MQKRNAAATKKPEAPAKQGRQNMSRAGPRAFIAQLGLGANLTEDSRFNSLRRTSQSLPKSAFDRNLPNSRHRHHLSSSVAATFIPGNDQREVDELEAPQSMAMPSSSASRCNSHFHKRTREPLLPPPSAVISSRFAKG